MEPLAPRVGTARAAIAAPISPPDHIATPHQPTVWISPSALLGNAPTAMNCVPQTTISKAVPAAPGAASKTVPTRPMTIARLKATHKAAMISWRLVPVD